MPAYGKPPLSEQSIAIQFGEPLPLTPTTAARIFRKLEAALPKLELKPPIGPLGVPMVPLIETVDELRPRYWYSSSDENVLLQLQHDMIALNWRKRTPPNDKDLTPYPGFTTSLKQLKVHFQDVLDMLEVRSPPAVSAINLYYDNLWWLPPGASAPADAFSFWNTMGVLTMGGPEVRFSAAVTNERGQPVVSVGPPARIDVIASNVVAVREGKPAPAGRIILTGHARPNSFDESFGLFEKLHNQISDLLPRLVTTKTLELWK